MRVLFLRTGADTGGQGYRLARALGRLHPSWEAHSIAATKTYIDYPEDVPWSPERAQELYDWADVVVHGNGLQGYEKFDRGQRKPAIVHHHGSRLRQHPRQIMAESASAGAVNMVSTTDLLDDAPGATWLPSPYDIDEMAAFRHERRDSNRLRIAHAPTVRSAKGTDLILAALNRLARRYPIEVDLIERARWRECLWRKGHADLYIDQITLGYGNNAIEAMAMGIPVISGWAEEADRKRHEKLVGPLPFLHATPLDIEERIEEMIRDADVRANYAAAGVEYVRRIHDENVVAKMAARIIESAPPSTGRVELSTLGVATVTRGGRAA